MVTPIHLSETVEKYLQKLCLEIPTRRVGSQGNRTATDFFARTMAASIHKVFSSYKDTIEGEPWYQSDHSLFIQNQVPALAITSDRFMELSTYVTHTAKDHLELVDYDKLVNVALALQDLLLDLQPGPAMDA